MFRTFSLQKIAVVIAFALTCAVGSQGQNPIQDKLLNGLKILMWPDASAGKVNVKLRIHAGSAFDPQGKEGTMQLLADSIFPDQASKEFFAEDLGGSLNVVTTYDYIEIDASSKPESMISMLETLANAVSNPSIDKETTAKVRAALLTRVTALEADPAYVADNAAAKRLLGTFPYGRPQLGSSTSVPKIEFADILDQKIRFLSADNATMAITGNFEKTPTMRAIRRLFGPWLKGDKRVPATFTQPEAPVVALLTVDSPKPGEGALRFVGRGVARNAPTFYSAAVFAKIVEERLKSALGPQHAKDVFVRSDAHLLPGTFMIGFPVYRSAGARFEANDLVPKALTDPISDAEFSAARNSIAAEWSRKDVADYWLDLDTYRTDTADADRKAIAKIQLSDVQQVASLIGSGAMATVLVNSPTK